MRIRVETLHVTLVNDALSFFVGKTVQRIATESGVDERVVRKVLAAATGVERKGNLFRIENIAPWRRA